MADRTILLDKQIDTFHRQGFLAIEQLTTTGEVSRIRDIFDKLFNEQAGRDDGDQFDLLGTGDDEKPESLPQIMYPAKYAPELNDTLLRQNTSIALSQLFGQQVEASFFHAINKPANHGAETPWHQDAAYWNPAQKHNKISVWVPLQDVTVENGCMQFIPNSHNLDILPHRNINDDPRVHGLELIPEEQDKIKEQAVPCPLPAGGATFHNGYTLHYAGPNQTANPRRAIILEAELPPVDRKKPLQFPWLDKREQARKQQ
ncbi:phytanoyl-CoA dioxygenase family protein [Aliifodinibius sp. S!AR15-10]|uniref:phytanoyl-CoA dioxygenase family protein n=1 Tax=Aliifodinibius sp. S!AR15-10 TaxID=2950437 RepID=UPI002862E2B1|nr:phytanoyl-CoA dioxygenase family protein [Aliifodinibius sp. S!AR15-10]MDR8392794.1 phytanoyl-CoA dioxygenase family protein [Aliifodinibius sp. S!AR15-10]